MKLRSLSQKALPISITAILVAIVSLGVISCSSTAQSEQPDPAAPPILVNTITEQEVLEFQQTWGDGIVRIGEMPTWKQAEIAAQEHIRQLYDYQREPVLFRPTLAYPDQFRTDSISALSYFVGRNPDYPLDDGFALAPYSNVSWKNVGINIIGNVAVAMGNYYFTYAGDDSILEVEYSFAYSKDQDGKLKIILQGSHLPYTPEEIEKIEEIKARSHKTYQ